MSHDREFSVCVLLYGDHRPLAQRCLGSIGATLSEGRCFVRDVRIGMNAVSSSVAAYVESWSRHVAPTHGLEVCLFVPPQNVGKHPMMRKMFFEPSMPLARYVMWFDDDTFLIPRSGWWPRVREAIQAADMIGQSKWFMPIHGNQWQWVCDQPWFNPEVGPPPRIGGQPKFRFCQGAWWVIRTEILHRYDWPPEEFRHQSGDYLLGELFRHQRLRLGEFTEAVRVNAEPFDFLRNRPTRRLAANRQGLELLAVFVYLYATKSFATIRGSVTALSISKPRHWGPKATSGGCHRTPDETAETLALSV